MYVVCIGLLCCVCGVYRSVVLCMPCVLVCCVVYVVCMCLLYCVCRVYRSVVLCMSCV